MCQQNTIIQAREVFPSAAYTATQTSPEIENTYGYRGFMLFVDVTADPAAASIVFTVETEMARAGDWATILTTAAVNSVSENVYMVYAGGPNVSNVSTGFHPGRRVRVVATHSDGDSITYSAELLWVN